MALNKKILWGMRNLPFSVWKQKIVFFEAGQSTSCQALAC